MNKYDEAASCFARSVRFYPLIGRSITWSRFGNIAYQVIKPYLAVVFCRLKAVMMAAKKQPRNPKKHPLPHKN